MNKTILQYLPLLFPLIIIPLIMRLIIAPIILFRLKSKYVKDLTSTIKDGWVDDRDLQAIEYLKNQAWKGLSTPFVISYNFNFLKTQTKTLFVDITRIYNDGAENEISLQFSLQKILEALYLVFEDLHKDLKQLKVYRFLERIPISLFLRITKFNKSVKIITQNKIIQLLQKYRITTKILRLVLIPILGLPIIISQIIFSLLYATIFEGYLRFIYGLILIKLGYYTIYLYSDRNSSLHNRLKFSYKEIINKGKIIESRHTKFMDRYNYSEFLNEALITLKKELKKENIMHSRDASHINDTFERLLKRITNTVKNTIENELNSEAQNPFDFKALLRISNSIGQTYFQDSEQPIYHLRVKEFIEFGYFVTTVSLKNIYTIPTSRKILDKIPLKLVFDINDFIEDKKLANYVPTLKKGGKIIKNLQGYYWATRFIVKKSHPLVFAASMVTPILVQQFQDSIKEYIYNMTGFLLIDAYESTLLKSKNCRIDNISSKISNN